MSDLFYNITNEKNVYSTLRSLLPKNKNQLDTMAAQKDNQEYYDVLDAAKRDLLNIQTLFNSTTDPDLIEYAIYEEYAIKLKLSYLIKKAKENGIKYYGTVDPSLQE